MLLLLGRQAPEDIAGPRVADQPGAPRIELEPAALGRDGDAQRVTGEHRVGGRGRARGAISLAAVLTGSVDLHDALARHEAPRLGDLRQQHFDIGAEKLGRPVAGLADQMEMPGMAIRVLEPEAAFAEVDLSGDARVHHPLERAVDGGPADALVFLAHQVDEIVGAQMTFLAQEDADHEVALAGALAAGRPQTFDVVCLRVHGHPGARNRPARRRSPGAGYPWPST